VTDTEGGKSVEKDYDPMPNVRCEEVGKLAGQFGARACHEGHTDSSIRGAIPESSVLDLSRNRANAVKRSAATKVSESSGESVRHQRPRLEPSSGPERCADQAKNRRVEIKVYPLSRQNSYN